MSDLFNRSSTYAQDLLRKMNDEDRNQIHHDLTYMESQEGLPFNQGEVSNFIATYYAAHYGEKR